MACPENVATMAEMTEQLNYLTRYLRKPLWLNRADSSLRVSFPSAQLVTLSGTNTVATVTSMTQKAGIDLSTTELRWQMKSKWDSHVRSRIS